MNFHNCQGESCKIRNVGRKARGGPWYDAVGERLRTAMEKVGLRQVQLAARMGVTEGAVSRWLDGRLPDPEVMATLVTVLGVSLDWVYGLRPAAGPTSKVSHPPAAAPPPGPPSLVRARLGLLDAHEVMLLRLDAQTRTRKKAPTIARGTVLMIDELLDSGDTHVVVGRVMTPATAHDEEASHERGGSKPAPLGRQHTGRPRGFRRQPALGAPEIADPANYVENDQEDL